MAYKHFPSVFFTTKVFHLIVYTNVSLLCCPLNRRMYNIIALPLYTNYNDVCLSQEDFKRLLTAEIDYLTEKNIQKRTVTDSIIWVKIDKT